MFGTTKSLVPEPRQIDQPRRYIGRHRVPEAAVERDTATIHVDGAGPVDAGPREADAA